jgi:hypothetical protein
MRGMMSNESSSTLFPVAGNVYVWRTPKEASPQSQIFGYNIETWGRFCDDLGSNDVVFCSSHY